MCLCSILSEGKIVSGVSILSANFAAFCLKGKSCLVFQCFYQILQHSVWRENCVWCFNAFTKFCSILSEGKTVSGVSILSPNFAAFCLKGKLCLVFQFFHQILQHSVWRENRIWCFNSFTKFLSCNSLYSIVCSRWVYFTFGSPPQSFLPYSYLGSSQNEVFSYSL